MVGSEGLRIAHPPAEAKAGELIEFPAPTIEQADLAIEHMLAQVRRVINPACGEEGYGTERAILPEPPHVPHRENDAEHSFHLAMAVKLLWHNRAAYGLCFPDNFSVHKAASMAVTHDLDEVFEPDVDTLTRDIDKVKSKKDLGRAAIENYRDVPGHAWVADEWGVYDRKETYEDKFLSDIDKLVGIVKIVVDKGRRWHNWDGESFSRDFMLGRQRGKLYTQNGQALLEAAERMLIKNPQLFPAEAFRQDKLDLFSND